MKPDEQWVIIGLVLGGSFVTLTGVLIRLGKGRAWYFLKKDYPVLMPRGANYSSPIGGLMIIMMGVSLLMPNQTTTRMIWAFIIFPLFVLSFLVTVIQPKWSKPNWVRTFEENHGDILEIPFHESRKIPSGRERKDWESRIGTEDGLEAWVAEVRRKHGLG